MATPKPAWDARAYFRRSAPRFDRITDEDQQSFLTRWFHRRWHADIAGRFALMMKHAVTGGARSVLDVGCGSGRHLARLDGVGVDRLVGIDLSAEMIALARRRLDEAGAINWDLVEGDFREWDSSERFDLVIALGFFDYQDDAAGILKRMRKCARKSVIASFPRRHWRRMPIRRFRYLFKNCPVFFYSLEEIVRLGREVGFARTSVCPIPGSSASYLAIFQI